ncbi:MAG: cation-translocating P-type ATPase, partial [Oscillospiraceae bacterium]|nr:cation-translocating P-type ATPase [Oscillospiraceae bacterium]
MQEGQGEKMKNNIEFYSKGISQSLQALDVDFNRGLTAEEAARRLETNGANRLQSMKKKTLFMRILAQFKDFLVIILIAAAIISVIAGDGLKDATIIIGILVINMIISITQENKADNALKELKGMSGPKAKVRRDGKVERIDSENVVIGDVIVLEAGDYIPADIRIIESVNLKIDESALTGESVSVEKEAEVVLAGGTSLGDRVNSAFMGTVVTYGRGAGVVCATGMDTEMGKIAVILNETDEGSTPLQDKLNAMAKTLGIICIATCALIFGIGFLYKMDLLEMLMVSVSLAVAAVPEGVAIVATVILAIGVQKMVKRNVIIKKLRAVETLGSTTVICSDKTGTLTQNKMTVTEIWAAGGDEKLRSEVLRCGALCSNVIRNIESGAPYIGEPTEIALMAAADKAEIDLSGYERTDEIPFDSATKFMQVTTQLTTDSGQRTTDWLKGSLEAVAKQCTDVGSAFMRSEEMAGRALRVLAFAYRDHPCEKFTFIGLQGIIDPPREEAKSAIAQCHAAGIKVKMITGDHKITALAIAKELGIAPEDVYARVSPEDKVNIVTRLKQDGHIVAMTGDGVNDAPSLKKADIGIAMGITGTDVSKEAADMILTDDNFTSIVGAVEQGRTIYGNIRKVTAYLLACNIGEILIILLAIIFGLPVPLTATQLLFVNLLTDAFPAFALGMENKEADVMTHPPRNPKEQIINKSMKGSVAFRSLFVCAGALGAFLFGLFAADNYAVAVSMCFFTLVAGELLVAYPSKTETKICFKRELFKNRFLNISIAVSMAILIAVMYVPVLNDLFSTVPLNFMQAAVCAGLVLVILAGSEVSKRLFKT